MCLNIYMWPSEKSVISASDQGKVWILVPLVSLVLINKDCWRIQCQQMILVCSLTKTFPTEGGHEYNTARLLKTTFILKPGIRTVRLTQFSKHWPSIPRGVSMREVRKDRKHGTLLGLPRESVAVQAFCSVHVSQKAGKFWCHSEVSEKWFSVRLHVGIIRNFKGTDPLGPFQNYWIRVFRVQVGWLWL